MTRGPGPGRRRRQAGLRTGAVLAAALLVGGGAAEPAAAQIPPRAPRPAADGASVTWRLGLGRATYPAPLDTIWRAGPLVHVGAEIPLRIGFVEFGVAGSRLTAVDPAPFDPDDVVRHPPDVLLLRPFAGLGWSARSGVVRPRASVRVGADIVRIVEEGYASADPNEMEWNAGVAGGVAWWPHERWSLGVTAGGRRVFNREAAWFWDAGVSVAARVGLPGAGAGLLAPPTSGAGDPAARGVAPGDGGDARPAGCRAVAPGTFRLSDLLENEARWRGASLWGLRHRFAPGGAGSFFGAQPEVLVDGLPMGPDVFGAAVLDRLALTVDDVRCVAAGTGPGVVGGRLAGPALLRLVTRTPAEGLTVGGSAVLGNEEGDAGLWAFSDRASINVDKAYGQMDASVALRRGPAWLRAGVGPRYVYPTDPAIRGRTEPRFGEGALVRLWVRPAWVQGHWGGEAWSVDAAGGASVMNDLVHEPRLGTESQDSTGHAHAAVRVRVAAAGLRVESGGSWSRSRLFGPRDSGPQRPGVEVLTRRVHGTVGVGDTLALHGEVAGGWDAIAFEGPGLAGGAGRLWARVGVGWRTPGGASLALDAQVARDGGRTVPAGRGRVDAPVGLASSAFLEVSSSGLGPVDDRSALAVAGAERFDGWGTTVEAWTPPADRLWTVDVGLERRGGVAVGASLRRHTGAARLDRSRAFDAATASFPATVRQAEPVDATVVSGWARGRWTTGALRAEASVDVPALLTDAPGARALFAPSTYAAAVARAGWVLDPRLETWVRLRARRGAAWPEFAGLAAATDGLWSDEVEAFAAVDLGTALRLAGGGVRLDVAVRNVTNRRIASHPLGLREDRGLYVRGALAWTVLR